MLDRMIKSMEELFEGVEAENLDTLNKYKEAAEHERPIKRS